MAVHTSAMPALPSTMRGRDGESLEAFRSASLAHAGVNKRHPVSNKVAEEDQHSACPLTSAHKPWQGVCLHPCTNIKIKLLDKIL